MSTFTTLANPVLIAAIQTNSGANLDENLDAAFHLIKRAKEQDAACAVLPENFAWMGCEKDAHQFSEIPGSGPVQTFLSQTAKNLGLWIIGGSHRIRDPQDSRQRVSNTSLVFNPQGEQVARYDKIHLFDADVNDGKPYRESDTIRPGKSLSIVDTGFVRIGQTICYDLRFPALYQALRRDGAELIVVPAAFTVPTGQAHWRTLLRARAIENQIYIVAPAQCGTHAEDRQTWGHSLCIDPWGEVIAELESEPGIILCPFDLQKLTDIRQKMPVFSHRRPSLY
jgi:nitrilase